MNIGKIAFVFPGQGSQKVGMGQDAFEKHAGARQVFERADEALAFSLSEIIFNGPEEKLKQTTHTQPALLTASIALLTVFKEKGIVADYVAGHSLGEYSALVAAGALSFEDAVRTVRARGQFMEQAVPQGQGAMAAVLGAERDALGQLCTLVSEEVDIVEMANLNCPGQIVVSGTAAGVEAIGARAKDVGARRVIPLEVSGPFHSSLMRTAADRLEGVLAELSINTPDVPVIANVTADEVDDAERVRRLLKEQVVSPVLWEDSVRLMIAKGVDTFFEIGSGNVLAGLIKKIDRNVRVYTIHDIASLEEDYDVG